MAPNRRRSLLAVGINCACARRMIVRRANSPAPARVRVSEAIFARNGTRMRCQGRSRAAGRPVQIAAIGELASRAPIPLLDLGSIAIAGRPPAAHLETVSQRLIIRVGRGSTAPARRQPAGLARLHSRGRHGSVTSRRSRPCQLGNLLWRAAESCRMPARRTVRPPPYRTRDRRNNLRHRGRGRPHPRTRTNETWANIPAMVRQLQVGRRNRPLPLGNLSERRKISRRTEVRGWTMKPSRQGRKEPPGQQRPRH